MCIRHHRDITRRSLLGQTAGIAAGLALSAHAPRMFAGNESAQPDGVPPLADVHPKQPTQWKHHRYGTSRRTAQLATLDEVKLQPGPFREAMERDHAYLLSLEPDRFLYYFRTTAGLEPKAAAYGGWEQKVGRMLGHYLSACSMSARATGDAAFMQRQDYIVGELARCQRANGNGYVGGIGDAKRIFSEIGQGNIYIDKAGLNGVHAPWYMLHKMCAGLRDAYLYGQNDQALVVLTGFSDWADRLTGPLSHTDMQKMLQDEHGGMNEVFADLYAITSKEKYLALSWRFNHISVLAPLAGGVDDLDGLHANTQIPPVLGLYRQYEVTGVEAARRGGEFFWETVTQNRSYVIGGDSDKERFYPKGQMAKNLSVATAETCNSYNMAKLTDRLFAREPREHLAAYSERVLWNDILASIDKTTPGMTYYLSLKPGHFKTFSRPYESFWCCVGTGMENHAKYGESIYFHSADELWINQFIASQIYWSDKKITILQSTRFPDEQQSQWTISCERPVRATLYLRHPTWTSGGFHVKINGRTTGASEPGSYLRLHRKWHDGDLITAELPMHLSVEPMKDDPSLKAILYGPLVLAGLLGRGDLPAEAPYAATDQLQFRSVPDPEVQPLFLAEGDLSKSFQQTAPLEFTGKSAESGNLIRFVPLAAVTRDRYSVYWKA